MLGTSLSSDVLERDAHLVGFLVEFGFRLAHVEHSATHSTAHATEDHIHDEEDKQHGAETDKKVKESVPSLRFVAEVCYLPSLLYGSQVFLQFVNRTIVNADVGILPRLLGRHVEDVTDMFGTYIHAQCSLAFVHHYLFGIIFLNVVFELGVCSLFLGSGSSTCSQ